MNKTIKNILALAVMSISFAACSQVDLVDDPTVGNSTKISVSIPSNVSDGYILIAHRVVGLHDYTLVNENEDSVLVGSYKFYAVSYPNSGFDYTAVLNTDEQKAVHSNVIEYTGTYNAQNDSKYSAIKSELSSVSGNFFKCSSPIYADSTLMVEVSTTNRSISFPDDGKYQVTPTYSIKENIYGDVAQAFVVISDVPTKAYLSGEGTSDAAKCNSIAELTNSTNAEDSKNSNAYSGSVTIFKLPSSGEATVYIKSGTGEVIKTTTTYKVKDSVVTLGTININSTK